MDSKTELQAVDHNQIILISENGSAVLMTPGRCVQLEVVTNAVLNAEDESCEIEVIQLSTEGGAA